MQGQQVLRSSILPSGMCAPGDKPPTIVTSVDVDLEASKPVAKKDSRPPTCCSKIDCTSRCILVLRVILVLASLAFIVYYLWRQLETLLACVAVLCLLGEFLRYEFTRVQKSLTDQALIEMGWAVEKSFEEAAVKMEAGLKDAASQVYSMLPSKEDLEEQFARDTRAAMAGLESALAGSEEHLRHVGERVAQQIRQAVEDETQALLQQLREWWQLKNLKVDKLVEPVRSSIGSCRQGAASCAGDCAGDNVSPSKVTALSAPVIDTPMAAKR